MMNSIIVELEKHSEGKAYWINQLETNPSPWKRGVVLNCIIHCVQIEFGNTWEAFMGKVLICRESGGMWIDRTTVLWLDYFNDHPVMYGSYNGFKASLFEVSDYMYK